MISFISCQRKELEEPYQYLAYIPVSIDWDESLLELESVANVSIYFYPTDGSAIVKKLSDDIYFNVVELPVGEYRVLIFNDLVNNVSGLSYNNESSYDEFSVHITEGDSSTPYYYDLTDDEVLVTAHSRMATWTMDEFIVDDAMIEYTRSNDFDEYIELVRTKSKSRSADADIDEDSDEIISLPDSKSTLVTKSMTSSLEDLSSVITQPLTTVLNIRVRVLNLNNAMTFETIMKGTANGAYFTQGENIVTDKTHLYHMIVTDREYDDPAYGIDGYVNFSHNTFGRVPDNEKYIITFHITVQSGELYEFERDITDLVRAYDGGTIDIDLTLGDDIISLPSISEPGFNVNDWGDDVVIYL